MKKALVLMTCLCMLVSMMTGITVGAAWDLMYYPVETESVIATSWKTAIDNGKYTAEDGTQKTYDLNGVADATLRYITPGANGTAGAIELAMVPNETVEDKKSDGTTVTRGPDYRPRILTNHMITLKTGNTYKISVYVKGNLSGTNDVNLWLNSGDKVTFDTDSSTPPAYRDVFKVRVTDQWQYVEKEFKVKEITDGSGNVKDSSSLTLGMRPMTNFPSGSFQVDELKVELTNKVASATNTVFTNGIGDGSVIDPYEITTVADIKKMAELVVENSSYQTAHYKLMNDIDMTGVTDFMGIATGPDTRNAFKGTFDGNNHVIKNMRIEETTTNTRGFFYAMYGATIKNLGFENAYVSGFKTGVLAGSDGGSTIENCFVRNATLKNLYQHTDGYMGAFVGCVTDMGSSRGGLITDHTVFTNCYATGIKTIGYKDTEVAVGGAFKGGRIWHTETYVTLNNCYTDYGQFAATGYKNANDDTPTDYPTDDEKIAAGTLVVNNSYKSATPSTVTASALGSAFIANKTEYNNGLPVLAWEADRLPEVEEPTMYTVSVTVGENGSVTKDGEPVPASFEVEEGSAVTLTLVPDDKYVAKAKVNGADYTVTNNQITLTVTEATIVAVTFERIPDVTPGFAGDSTSYSWFKTVDGKATIFTYHKLADFNTGETDLEYGVKLWNNAKPEDKVTLPAYDSATEQPAKAVPGAMFAIRVYGSAITADQTYTILPYIGTETGSETTPDYE